MKTQKIVIGSALLALFTILTPISHTQAATTSEAQFSHIKTQALLGIDARSVRLQDYINRVSEQKLGGGDKKEILASTQAELVALANAKVKISADTDLVTLQADIAEMAGTYLAVRVSDAKAVMALHAEGMEKRTDRLVAMAAQFELQLASLGNSGKNVTALQVSLATLKSKLADADLNYEKATDMITPIIPNAGDMASLKINNTTLQSARALVHAGGIQLHDATALARSIKQGIKSLGK